MTTMLLIFPMGSKCYGRRIAFRGRMARIFHPALDVNSADMIIRKGFRPEIDSYSAFFENDRLTPTGLEGYLRSRNVERVHFVGLATDFCVRYSAVDSVGLDFKTVVYEDACRAIDLNGSLARPNGKCGNGAWSWRGCPSKRIP